MSIIDIKKIALEMQDAINKGDINAYYEHIADDYFFHRPPFPPVVGKHLNKKSDQALLNAFTNQEVTIHEVITEKETVIIRYTWQAYHTGTSPSLGVPATGKLITLDGCKIFHFNGRKVIEQWDYIDMLGLVQQLEIFPIAA